MSSLCPCGSGRDFDDCCGPVLAGKLAVTAADLMRARYTAYTRGNLDFVEQSCTEEARAKFNRPALESGTKQAEWLGLNILATQLGGEEDEAGVVDFAFTYRYEGTEFTQREIAAFIKKDGKWLFNDSEINPTQPPVHSDKVGRNEPCPCGSGKKYKKCCGA